MKDKALGEKVLTAVSPGQQMVKIVQDELTELMGGTESDFNINGNPAIILIAGLFTARRVGQLLNRWLTTRELEPPVRMLIGRAVSLVVLLLFAMMALQNLGTASVTRLLEDTAPSTESDIGSAIAALTAGRPPEAIE